jgi:hypothetical protein
METNPLDPTQPASPKRGHPPIQPTPAQRQLVKQLAGWGLRQDHIASTVKVDPKTLRKYYREELDEGLIHAKSSVLSSLFDMATSRRNSAATIFWAKTRGDFTPEEKDPLPPGTRRTSHSSPKPKPVRQSSLEGLTAHCNDGAPNGDI